MWSWAPVRTPAPSTSARAGRSPSRSSRTTTRARSSPSRECRDRRRRDPARRLRARCPADRGARLPALRRARLRPLPLPARACRRRDRPLRQLDRGADDRRRDRLRASLRAELPDQRDVRPGSPDRLDGAGGGGEGRQRHRPDGSDDRTRRDRRRLGARLGRARGQRGRSGRRCRSATFEEEGHGVLHLELLERTCSSRCRISAPRASRPRQARWPRRAASGSTSTFSRSPSGTPTSSRSR